MRGLTKSAALELGPHQIRVNSIHPGFIRTPMTKHFPDNMLTIPLGRPGTPQEAASAVFLLCSPWANYIHGQIINVTGGQFSGMYT